VNLDKSKFKCWSGVERRIWMLLQAVFYINEVRDIGKYLSLVEGDGISSFIFGKKIQLFLH